MARDVRSGRLVELLSWSLNAIIMLASLVLAVSLAEIVLRMTGLAKVPASQNSPYPRSYYALDDAGGFDLAERFPPTDFALTEYAELYKSFIPIWSNEIGCFDHPVVSGSGTILLVGDSFSWGYVPFEKTWGSVVERETGVRVVKCGVGGYGPRQARLKAAKVVRRIGAPAVVLLGYYIGNDLMDDYLFPMATVKDGYLASRVSLLDETTGARRVLTDSEIEANKQAAMEPPHGLGAVKKFIASHSALYNLLRNNWQLRSLMASVGLADPPPLSPTPLVFRPADRYPWLVGAWTEHLKSLRDFAREVRGFGAQLVVVIIPTREQVYPFLRPRGGKANWEFPDQKVRDFLESEGIPTIDLLTEFRARLKSASGRELDPRRDLYWHHDIHLSIPGNQLTGLLVSRYLLDHELLHPADAEQRRASIEQEVAHYPAQ